MADEITINISASVANGNLISAFTPGEVLRTQTTKGLWSSVVTIGTGVGEQVLPVDITTPGIIGMMNLDSTNFVSWGPYYSSSMRTIGKLLAGDVALFRLNTSIHNLWMEADTAPVKVLIWLLDT